ncbi:MAG: hypothetical protein LBV60_25335, partial [Streptomyces sp.]|nr:hypothetical protein [Streptomyces sp.]
MNGASREALAATRERLDALTDSTSVDATQLADELAAVTALLDREASLRRVITDPAQSGEAKAELVIGTIAFAIVFFFFWKKLLPNINKVLEERRAAIEGGIEEADAM